MDRYACPAKRKERAWSPRPFPTRLGTREPVRARAPDGARTGSVAPMRSGRRQSPVLIGSLSTGGTILDHGQIVVGTTFVGFKIAEWHYENAVDKDRAVRQLIEWDDENAFLASSGYAKKF